MLRADDPERAVRKCLEELERHPAFNLQDVPEEAEGQLIEAARQGDYQLELAIIRIART